MSGLKPYIAKVATRHALTREEASGAFEVLMSGEASMAQIGGFLMALRVRGETVDEIAGAVSIMRSKMVPVDAPADAIDIVGTGGDGTNTYNISTLAALIVAGAGVPVAKHGNRALSSKSGAADSLSALGVRLDIDPETIARCIREAGIGFMFAQLHHPAMRHVGAARVELGTRTIFNIVGPLSSPASVKRQLFGVYSPEWLLPGAEALRDLGLESAWVVHGSGLDEITTTGPTQVAALKDGEITTFELTPEDFGVPTVTLDAIRGGDGAFNAAALKAVLDGAKNAYRDVALCNAAASLIVAGKATSVREGMTLASQSLDSGSAAQALEKLIAISNQAPRD
ncbi:MULTISPECIES: anthranilate phosphoribosyltransferase [Alphaproteobacteria]|uniref:Anthranilate phosphoribosyltransferase n=2 Tax=Alphaproteobacteria TaxID=28211 RepID=A0A512HCT2_9HYPH|nr:MULTISPECIES: anthranilate phosphoribosyltransferase [Alphaproteobacteria]GEO83254.1 anthranilate phosphoribosyltransferase [Ciceribacter naphthalenivorans]GLR20351.1 anthranilate phosphoribosyltransferase [Ciceribacter naphthalenivorans]GLT03207.1 anthranilate phosphoribosyltransferase [Sphingomonas psychrolutea]